MRLRALPPLAVLVLAALAQPSPALAQPSPAQIEASKKAAAEAADKAFDAYQAGKFADAIGGFQRADAAFHAPKFQLYVARSQARLGKLVAAKSTYDAIVAEKLPVFAPQEFFSAQADAKKELAELTKRIPSLQIQAKDGIQTVTLDGKPVPLGKPVPVDPGDHTLTGAGPGTIEARLTIKVQEGEKKTALLEPSASDPVPTTTATTTATADPPSPGSTSRIPTPTYVAYGAGAVGLVVGGIFSGLTLAKKGDYDTLRKADPIDAGQVNDAAAQGRTFAVVADVGFLLAIAGAAAGTIVWIVSPKPKEAVGDVQNASPALFVAPRMGGVTLGGSF